MRVLNVGGGSRNLPADYDGCEQILLDADPAVKPDLCMDAKHLVDADIEPVDAVYCSHCLEHFHRHEVPKVLAGFRKVVKENGYVEIIVPNLTHAMQTMLERGLDVEDTYYRAGFNAISFHDVLYGWDKAMSGGNLFYAHKCGFTVASLHKALEMAGFVGIEVYDGGPNIRGIGRCLSP